MIILFKEINNYYYKWMTTVKVLSIDIGIINLGYVFAELNIIIPEGTNKIKNKYYTNCVNENINILDCNRINITNIKHSKVNWCDCKLHHENCIPDYIDHFIQEKNTIFEEADIIIIERQPPIGITNVQDLLFTKFRDKVLLISPNSVHKYFSMSKDYTIRKQQSDKIAMDYLNVQSSFLNNIRKHDMSDAMLMILYYYKTSVGKLLVSRKM